MKKSTKYAIRVFLVLTLILVTLGLTYRKDIARLRHVLSLFDQENIVKNFSNMDDIFFNRPLKNEGGSKKWQEAFSPYVKTYTFKGEEKKVDSFLEETKTTSFLVIYDGQLVSEKYYLGTKKEDLRISWSMAKSFLSAIVGVAIEKGEIESIEDPVTKYVPALKNSAYDGVSLRNVLNMSSGVKFNEDYLDFSSDINKMGRVLALGGSMDAFAAGVDERIRPAGKLRKYTSIDTHVIAMVVRAATKKSLPTLFEENIWSKIEPEGKAYFLTDGKGVAFALGGLNMQSRDYAKFGELYLNEGAWENTQVIPRTWAVKSVQASAPPSHDKNDKFGYGYQWWVPVQADEEFYAIGVYGQYIYINRRNRVVIVKTSAHREFRNDGQSGNLVEQETIEMFRSISKHYSQHSK